jgi:hypothetical protein
VIPGIYLKTAAGDHEDTTRRVICCQPPDAGLCPNQKGTSASADSTSLSGCFGVAAHEHVSALTGACKRSQLLPACKVLAPACRRHNSRATSQCCRPTAMQLQGPLRLLTATVTLHQDGRRTTRPGSTTTNSSSSWRRCRALAAVSHPAARHLSITLEDSRRRRSHSSPP